MQRDGKAVSISTGSISIGQMQWMSLIGHIVYATIAAWVFRALIDRGGWACYQPMHFHYICIYPAGSMDHLL